jgi:pyrimidine operon attenuation protein/uracil phosphoribosyltransferase
MTTLEELQIQVGDLREIIRVADSGSMEATTQLRAQTGLMKALRQNQIDMQVTLKGIQSTLGYQADAIADCILSLSRIHPKVNQLDLKVHRMDRNIEQLDLKVQRIDGNVNQLDLKVHRMDGKIEAIMRHLGVETPEQPS